MRINYLILLLTATQTQIVKSYDHQVLISHVEKSIQNADNLSSKLSTEALAMTGFSSPRVRHLLNNLCSLPQNNYLEIGVWQGSTFISALYLNENNNKSAIGIDNWIEFGFSTKEFLQNTAHFIKNVNFNFFEADCFSINLDAFKDKISIFFYDGNHSFEAQKKAFTYFNPIFADVFIAVVDDYDWSQVHAGTQAAIKELNYNVLYEKHLSSPSLNNSESWWNGLYVAVISKK